MGFGFGGFSLGSLTSAAAPIIGGTVAGPAGAAAAGGGGSGGFSLGDAADAAALAGSVLGLGQSVAGGRSVNLNQQRYFTRIQDRVADAKKAGIHPLYALGATTTPVGGISGSSGGGVADALTNLADTAGGIHGRTQSRKRQAVIDAASIEESRARAVASRASAARDHAAALESASRVARAAQAVQSTGVGRALHPDEEAAPDRRTKLRMFGEELTPNPWFSSSEAGESEWHELGGLILGLMNMFATPLYEAQQRAKKRGGPKPSGPVFDPHGGTP